MKSIGGSKKTLKGIVTSFHQKIENLFSWFIRHKIYISSTTSWKKWIKPSNMENLVGTYFVTSTKIAAEEKQQNSSWGTMHKLWKLCSERKDCGQKWLPTLYLPDRLISITYILTMLWQLGQIYKWFCHHNTGSCCSQYFPV